MKENNKLKGRKRERFIGSSTDEPLLQSTPKRRKESLNLSDTCDRIHSILLDSTTSEEASDLNESEHYLDQRVFEEVDELWGYESVLFEDISLNGSMPSLTNSEYSVVEDGSNIVVHDERGIRLNGVLNRLPERRCNTLR